VGVWRLDASAPGAASAPARFVATLKAGSFATGAALSPDGKRLAVRYYWGISEYTVPRDGSVLDHLDEASPCFLIPPLEKQGEAISYSAAGNAILTVSEGSAPRFFSLSRREASKE
jgi:hypothetical protein